MESRGLVYDVIVVGAGPGGAVLAYELAQCGLEVLILEKATLPRYKPCGGGLTRNAFLALPFDATPAIELWADGGSVTYGGQFLFRADVHPPVACLVMRDRFDHFLVQQAVQADVHLVEGVAVAGVEEQARQVVVRTERGSFAARLLAGADGVNSVVARSTGLLPRREVGVAIEAEVDVPSAALDAQGSYATFDFGALPYGYGWVFPKRDHLSVGVFHARMGRAPELKRYLEAFIESQPVLREHQHVSVRGHRIPLGGREEPLHKGRVLLVGDAANLADPWLGEGLYYAVASARIAAQVIVDSLRRDVVDLSDYTARVNAGIVRQFRHARRLAAVLYRIPRLSSTLLERSPLMQDAVFGTMRGDLTFRQLNRRLAVQLPRILFQALSSE